MGKVQTNEGMSLALELKINTSFKQNHMCSRGKVSKKAEKFDIIKSENFLLIRISNEFINSGSSLTTF